MPPIARYLALVLLLIATSFARADSWGPLESSQVRSPTGKYELRITPEKHWADKPGHCTAALYQVGADDQPVWSRHLINDEGPVTTFVADSGRYVVTMDEWGSIGELPVVIYGSNGRLIKVHSTDSLGLKDDILHIEQSVSSYHWNQNAITCFDREEEVLFIRLHWGKVLMIQLHNGNLMDEGWYVFRDNPGKWRNLQAHAAEQIRSRALQLLHSESDDERAAGALVCGQEQIRQAIPRLRELLTDDASYDETHATTPSPTTRRVYYVRQAARDALKSLGQPVPDVVIEEPL